MRREMLRAKVHRIRVTERDIEYEGSLTLDKDLMESAGMLPFEKVQVLNVNNAQRFETYIIEGEENSGVVCLNGPAARLGQPGDIIIAITYAQMDAEEAKAHHPKVVHVDANNAICAIDENPA